MLNSNRAASSSDKTLSGNRINYELSTALFCKIFVFFKKIMCPFTFIIHKTIKNISLRLHFFNGFVCFYIQVQLIHRGYHSKKSEEGGPYNSHNHIFATQSSSRH
jgi:hypothetical protein